MSELEIRTATEADVPLILQFIRDLAEYERSAHEVAATEELLRTTLFGNPRFAEVLIGEDSGEPVAFALFFHNYSTWTGKPGLYLEDLYVKPEARRNGHGRTMLSRLAAIAKERNCARFEWAVLDWNTPAIDFYRSLGAVPMSEWRVMRVSGEALDALACYPSSPRNSRS
ncbi:MAG TPA: GNAT family N-acetyltransferase [Thermoanaerobaculia bacterium]|jgi:GNAT superfamily N-acetyltransferase|nr:GNAT family N-acetyltransferase [Thermoanaerobaculia bacterium]